MSSRVLGDQESTRAVPIVWPSHAIAVSSGERAEKESTRDETSLDFNLLEERYHQLEQKIEVLVRDNRELGFQEGEAAARAQSEAATKPLFERLGRTIEELVELRSRVMRRAESDLLKLSLEIARRVLNRELTVDPVAVEGLIQAAIRKLQSHEVYRVRVHPEMEPAVRSCLASRGPIQNLKVVADPALERGAIIFETARGSLDASIDTQLREIERGLTDSAARR